MSGNPICRQIDWDTNPEHLAAWKEGRTGFPWIDAIMIQLRTWVREGDVGSPRLLFIAHVHCFLSCCAYRACRTMAQGWMHHLARHSVACFLTRGDLYISWEEGKDVFEEYLIDQV
jgi:cryptochrome